MLELMEVRSGSSPTYSFVVPICNEEQTLPELGRRLAAVLDRLDAPGEVIFVDDGSEDRSLELMADLNARDPRFRIVELSRNFGHQLAITAGLDVASGDAVVVMDGDLQDPPEVALEMIDRWREGFDVVYAIREARDGEPFLRKLRAAAFYRVLRRLTDADIPVDVGDFRLVDRRALDTFRAMRERNRYIRGMFSWIGFRQTGVPFRRAERYAGSTKYPLRKLAKLAADGMLSFSNAPLRLALKLGFLISIGSFLLGAGAIVAKAAGLYEVHGLASLAVMVSFLGGMQLVILGVLGEYIGRIHDEVKGRPLYVVNHMVGLESSLPVEERVIRGGPETIEQHPPEPRRAANGRRVPA